MIDAGERAAITQAVRRAIGDARDGGSAAVDAALAQLGWHAMLDDEPDEAIAIVFRELGGANATASVLDDVLASALGERPRADLAVLLPDFATWQPPGHEDAGAVAALGLATARIASATDVLIVFGSVEKACAALVPAAVLTVDEVRGLDPTAALRRVRVQGGVSRAKRLDPTAWQSAVALGRRALAHEIAGACRSMLDLARTHALTRAQFGRPVARFQAVRHRLADTLVAVEALEAVLDAAREQPSAESAALAKAIAGRTASTVIRHCQQVLAGIGFTTEHSFHRFAKRVLVLEGLFGSADRIVVDVGRRLLAERRVPTLIEL